MCNCTSGNLEIPGSIAFLADAVGGGQGHVFEEHLVDLVIAADGQDRTGRDARALYSDRSR
jgi:hypothetical protein